MFYFDYTFWLLIPALIFAFYAQSRVKANGGSGRSGDFKI